MKIWHFKRRRCRKFIGLSVTIFVIVVMGGTVAAVAETANGRSAQKNITVAADQLIVDRSANTAEFVGNVKVTRSDGYLTADRLVVYYRNNSTATPNENRSVNLHSGIDKMVAEGHVRIETPQIVATGERAVYRQENRTIVLSGTNAGIRSGNNSVAGTSITLYIDNDSISVLGDTNRRVEAILTPGQPN